jgi:transglutaminase-like putative cysteine protease
MKQNKFLLLAAMLLTAVSATAQTAEEVKQTFPGQELVFLNYNENLKLYLKDGVPVAERNTEKEILVLSEKNASAYSRYKVYHSGYNEMTNLEAYTKVPDGDKYKKVKIGEQKTTSSSSNSVFYDDVKETSFDFPALTQNAIEHVELTQFHKDAHLLTPFYLPGTLPVINSTYTVTVPNDITIKYIVKNDPKGIFQFTVDKKRKETIYTWTAKNVKGDDSYGNAPDFRYFVPHIIVYIASYQGENGPQNFLSSAEDLYKWNYSFTKELNTSQDEALKKIVDSLIAGKTSETDKAKQIYRWVQQHIKYVAFENGLEGFRPRQAADVCSKRYGDCKDMSSIITQMLRMAGIKAYYTWIGTRSLPYYYSEVPLPMVDNHMIAAASINNEWVFLDGTDPHAKYGMPPSSIQDKDAMIAINDNEFKIIRVPVTAAAKSLAVDSTIISFTPDGIKGNTSVNYSGYFGEDIYNTLLYRDEKETKDFVKSRMTKASNKFILGNYVINKTSPEENNINISADFEIPGYGKKIGNEYYINLNLEKLFENRFIDTAKRKVAIENEFQFVVKLYTILRLPEGYGVTYQPKDFNFENDLVALKITYQVKEGRIIALQEMQQKKLMIQPADFTEWNRAAKAAAQQYKEQVVLEKK